MIRRGTQREIADGGKVFGSDDILIAPGGTMIDAETDSPARVVDAQEIAILSGPDTTEDDPVIFAPGGVEVARLSAPHQCLWAIHVGERWYVSP